MADAPTGDTPSDTETTPDPTPTPDAAQSDTDLAAEVEKWKALAKKHEDRAKGNATKAKELEELQKSQMSDTERAITEARDSAFKEGRAAGLAREISAEFKAAAAGRNVDIDAILENLDVNKFITDDGEADAKAINAFVERVAPKPEEPKGPLDGLDLGQGTQATVPIGDDKGIENMLREAVGLPKS